MKAPDGSVQRNVQECILRKSTRWAKKQFVKRAERNFTSVLLTRVDSVLVFVTECEYTNDEASYGVKTIPVDIPKFLKLLPASKYGTGTIAKAAKAHPDEIQKLIALGKGKFPLVRKLEKIIGDFRL